MFIYIPAQQLTNSKAVQSPLLYTTDGKFSFIYIHMYVYAD